MSRERLPNPRQSSVNRPMAVRKTEPTKKQSGCGGFGVVLFLLVIGFVVLLMTGIIPSPTDKKITSPPPVETNATVLFFNTPAGNDTIDPSLTPADLSPTKTTAATNTPLPSPTARAMPYVLRGAPEGYPNALLHPQYQCNEYLFVGGEIWDLREAPVLGLKVRLTGSYGGETVDFTSKSGDVTLYGQSGFEFVMENKQIAAETIYIQLFDTNDNPLSAPVRLSITGRCDANLLIVNYKQVQEISNN